MAAKVAINLLPQEVVAKGGVARTSSGIRTGLIFGSFLLVLVLALGIGFLLLTGAQIADSRQKQTGLTEKIAALEATEQSLFLAKDRLQSIREVRSDKFLLELGRLEGVIARLPTDIALSDAEISQEETKLTFVSGNSSALAGLFAAINEAQYKSSTLKSFSFNPTVGYLISVIVKNE